MRLKDDRKQETKYSIVNILAEDPNPLFFTGSGSYPFAFFSPKPAYVITFMLVRNQINSATRIF